MGQTLTNGVYLPDNGERNCYVGLSQNWQKLDNLLGNKGDKVSFAQTLTEGVEIGKITINGVDVSLFHTDYSSDIASKAKASDLTAHTSDTDIHVTTSDKNKWNAKQDALSSQQIANINDVTNKANDSDVVHKSGNETIEGVKTFNNGLKTPSCSGTNGLGLFGGNMYNDGVWIQLGAYGSNNGLRIRETLDKEKDTYNELFFHNGNFCSGDTNFVNLGTSTNKWKTINGINPGALSLPNLIDAIDISASLDTSQSSENTYTPPSDGYISILGRSAVTCGIMIKTGLLASMSYSLIEFGNTDKVSYCMCPVFKNQTVTIWLKSVTTLDSAKFFPCQGNV